MAPHQGLSSDEETFYAAMKITSSSAIPMVLNAAIELNLFQLIKDAGPGASLSAADLASNLPASDPHHAATQIDRILRFLSAHSVVSCVHKPLPEGDVQRFYSLLPVCKYLTANEEGYSLAPISLMIQGKVMMDSWYHVKDAVVEGGIAFNRAYGMSIFEYTSVDPKFNDMFNQGLYESSSIMMKKIVKAYDGFEGVGTLVDVGGGTGATLKAILAKHPNIKAINFDLPHVVVNAPPHPGVEHVGGDMFVSVPKGDAIFMKWILHDWSDEHCARLLKNCYESLPENGKAVVADAILMREPKEGGRNGSDLGAFERAARLDVLMLATNPGGKERSEEEFEALAKGAGFKRFVKVCYAYNSWVMEFHK